MLRGALLVSIFLLAPQAARPSTLLAFPPGKTDLKQWMSAGGWQSKRDDPGRWELADGALRLVSAADSVLIATDRGFPLETASTPRLRLTLMVKTVPNGTELSRKSGDDAALRVYLAFDQGGGFFRPPNTLAYAWTEKDDEGTLIRSSYFSNLWYISLGKGPTRQDQWTVVERDLAADYRRAFPKETSLPRLRGLLLKCDSNDTKTAAESKLSKIELLQRETPR